MPARLLPPTSENLALAAQVLNAGGLVAFPTETVYGLGANALVGNAVRKIFEAKGRPATNPLIVHVSSLDDARKLALRWPDAAEALATKHWPGPLTLVVEKTPEIPDLVTAGGSTVGLRVPAHPIARELIRLAGVPVAAPSANRSEEVSPTTARHVLDSLGPYLDDLLILDGGPCEVGIESAVIDVTGDQPRVLRPGTLALGAVSVACSDGPTRSPGQRRRHYAPRKPLLMVRSDDNKFSMWPADGMLLFPDDPAAAAALLYAELRRLDADPAVARIVVVEPPDGPAWDAIRDRLTRAAAKP